MEDQLTKRKQKRSQRSNRINTSKLQDFEEDTSTETQDCPKSSREFTKARYAQDSGKGERKWPRGRRLTTKTARLGSKTENHFEKPANDFGTTVVERKQRLDVPALEKKMRRNRLRINPCSLKKGLRGILKNGKFGNSDEDFKVKGMGERKRKNVTIDLKKNIYHFTVKLNIF